ncbi:NTP transferase domain-containing protein [uncultured Paracoccus sp.]|uniref:nucleotidyltransferase family protein n=1 Tax=uncultured Paracoccus sp. TaxID=189685 RepID=UPI00262D945E|nr:NTP transferase domain-containing protein [uncultured Paracoccus sp.]
MTQAGPVAGVLLAAGHSRRWGPGNKLLAEYAGRPLVCHAAATLQRAPVALRAVVLRDAAVADLLSDLIHIAPDGDDQSGSLRAAAGWAAAQGAGRLLILLGDMPALSDATVAAVIDACDDRPAAVRHPDGRPGVPACFPATAFPLLSTLQGDRGAGALLDECRIIQAPPAELLDVDRPGDL